MPRVSTEHANEPIYFQSPAALSSWFTKNHAKKTELWVGYFKKHTGKQVLSWSLAVDEALCWGWIDGVKKSVDADRTIQRFTPRKAKSHWSKVNVAKVAELELGGRMQEPGRAAFALRTEENTGQMSFEREAVPLSGEFASMLADVPKAAEWHAKQPPGYRRSAEDWVMSAKQDVTRKKRLATLVDSATQGLRVPHLRR
ncbi:Bacteriocin-protection protein [Mycena sanguinolenta]|uniref:Bacteriocin-protection protein n=1 Tax=Mycena sanguinolenta TaxID=230812 RepID=A0A8H6XQE8_9AGAR|nr:Bacteriocin-protection protein [Mycena sanguinolenta]